MRFNIRKSWKIVVIQFILICAFVLYGKTFIANPGDDILEQIEQNNNNVKFLNPKNDPVFNRNTAGFEKIRKLVHPSPKKFSDLFYTFNQTVNYGNDINELFTVRRVCFREGSFNLNDSNNRRAFNDKNNKKNDTKTEFVDEYFSNETSVASISSQECECQPEWHGSDCGQPEIVWRAFMKSQQPLKPAKVAKTPHNIFYIINSVSSINLETLEIQMMSVIDVVNLFIMCDLIKTDDPTRLLRYHLNQGLFRNHSDQILLIKDESCAARNIYRKVKKTLGNQMRPQDVLVYSEPDEILSAKALNYFKWYENWPQPVKFRLKYNVFGFFFKHPDNTVTRSMTCQLNFLEQFYKSDPDLVVNSAPFPFIIGDLNHFAGWFCEYCYQPIDIIRKLNLDNSLVNSSVFQQKKVVDIEYVQSLITKGLFIDGKLELIKLKHYHDTKYYMPDYVAKNRWKFDNIVVNLYASWDADLDNNDYLF